ncbi:DUF3027 domain-containing protein [Arthrobacter sp. I2-34]|uniref:DUF3027 domain-containing protein n=1 Tax=Arthrobacter hankyongi TaxID=2904801 RepID=A0ABS9L320_9MICC|nr:DUF3027 domain-containing protein [Arthrobacter hankyongi]MCG2621040.1 DUF3027 domain-containing protein [Arthrobacter hankyongi]
MTENPTDLEAGTAPAVPRRPAARRTAKLDAVLAAAVDSARAGVLGVAPAGQVGAHVGAWAEGERLVLHRFEAMLPGYRGWQWYATVARVPRGKQATVCEVGLLPSDDSLLAPEWVPWADRVRPEDVVQSGAEESEVDESDAEPLAGAEPDPAADSAEDSGGDPGQESARDSE